ncbi:hypothetical protein B0H12DRAFT_819216 [Mycena haematopus]|nr:hypothetical protein B0H12DRAFT_819216 [Mycena haematopus]
MQRRAARHVPSHASTAHRSRLPQAHPRRLQLHRHHVQPHRTATIDSTGTHQSALAPEHPQVDSNTGTSTRGPCAAPTAPTQHSSPPHPTAPLDPRLAQHLHSAHSAVDVEAPASLSCYHWGRHQVVSSPRILE